MFKKRFYIWLSIWLSLCWSIGYRPYRPAIQTENIKVIHKLKRNYKPKASRSSFKLLPEIVTIIPISIPSSTSSTSTSTTTSTTSTTSPNSNKLYDDSCLGHKMDRNAAYKCWYPLIQNKDYNWNDRRMFDTLYCESTGSNVIRNGRFVGLLQIGNGPTDPVANVRRAWEMYNAAIDRGASGYSPWECAS